VGLLVERDARLVKMRAMGELDISLQRELEAEVLSLATIGNKQFLVDLAATTHIQYKVLADLLGLYRQIQQLGGVLAISSPDAYLLEILATEDIPRTIPVFPSEASAALGIPDSSVAWESVPREGEREGSGLCL
jgi:anti-anti-sigma regulatory factor